MLVNDTDRARDALYSIPSDIEHDTRVRVGMGAKDGGVTFDDYDQWQATNPRYDQQEVRSMWNSFKPGAVGVATLFKIAAGHGWRMGGDKPTPRPKQATTKPVEPPRKPAKGMSPAEVWSRGEAATAGHGYITAKDAAGVPLDSLRVLPAGDGLRIAGQSMAGALVVPAFGPDGLQSLQLIPPPSAGKKLNLPGAPMAGASFTVGDVVPGGVVHIVEGVGQAWAVWQATGAAAVVCFGAGNMGKVAATLRVADPAARLVLVADRGKEQLVQDIAAAVGGQFVLMPECEASNFDCSDLSQRDGRDVLEALLLAAREPAKPQPLLKPVSVFDVLTNPALPPAFVWDGYLPRGVVALLGAHGGTGKSTIALMLVVCAALGRPLFGVDTVQCKTLFVSLEDGAHIVRHRLAGICKTWAIDPRELDGKLHIVDGTENPELFSADARGAGDTTSAYSELCKLVQGTGAGLVVVDNASDAFGGDEINRRQVRAFMRSLAQVARLKNCAALLLAHVDKGTSRARKAEGGEGYSGSTAWHNSARSRLFMTRAEDGLLTLEHQKSNLSKLREPLTLVWPVDGLPHVVDAGADGFAPQQGRADDTAAAGLLRIIAEYESREQYCSPMATARNNVFSMLKSDPTFKALKLHGDDCKRIVTQCQRAKWLEPLEYRSSDRKDRQRWTLTPEGKAFAGVFAPTAPTCAHMPVLDDGAQGANGGAPTAPTYAGGVGESARADDGAEQGSLPDTEPLLTDTTNQDVGAPLEQEVGQA